MHGNGVQHTKVKNLRNEIKLLIYIWLSFMPTIWQCVYNERANSDLWFFLWELTTLKAITHYLLHPFYSTQLFLLEDFSLQLRSVRRSIFQQEFFFYLNKSIDFLIFLIARSTGREHTNILICFYICRLVWMDNKHNQYLRQNFTLSILFLQCRGGV